MITYGVIILRENNTILLCHPTGHDINKMSIPKGLANDRETPIDAAIRETKEETGLKLTPHKLIPLKKVKYKGRNKTLQPFYYLIREEELVGIEFNCNSFFTLNGIEIPECDRWEWVDFNDIKYDIHLTQVSAISELKSKLRILK
jgi:8-oxo-dGTP pyrophosphatase MutT (NUDIX family)